jgi:hypothetical protein
MLDLAATIAAFGGEKSSLRVLDVPDADVLAYATLLDRSRADGSLLSAIQAVYEWQGAPLMFLVDAAEVRDAPDRLLAIRRLLAMRGDAPYLGIVDVGHLDVYRIALDQKTTGQARVSEAHDPAEPWMVLPHLANHRPDAALSDRHWISQVVLRLLTDAINDLIQRAKVNHEDAISLVGRALFTRFLADRALLPDAMAKDATALFDNAGATRETSDWLDRTFNGDLLPLTDGAFEALSVDACWVLGNILRRAPGGQLHLDWQESWDRLDFAHIPVGVLSQAYELYLRNHAPERQRSKGGYYTPRPIADLVVRAAFKGLEDRRDDEQIRVLDPAAGAGVFLLTAFRELVAEEWRATSVRPSTARLRQILYNQITGFDIDEAALRFGALGLYLLSIELDPDPQPVDKLAFANLRGSVLHLLVDENGEPGLGSLGPLVNETHKGRYDVVIGNPPWATGTKLANWDFTRTLVTSIARRRGLEDPPALLPNEVLDLPFVWRAMEWAKPGGQIAFALHARMLFQQGDGMPGARHAIFEALDVTAVINGADLRQTKVWPEVTAPFCLLFARNRSTPPGAAFRFVSPYRETSLNAAGQMRIDALNAVPVSHEQLYHTPELFKVLFRGTRADAAIIDRLRADDHPTIEAYWRREIGPPLKGHLDGVGQGYQTIRPSSRVRKDGDGRPGADASYLHGLPTLTVGALSDVLIDPSKLLEFQHERVHDPRRRRIFDGPLMLLHKSPRAMNERITTAVSESDIAYNETFYGYSPGSIQKSSILVRYLALILGSRIAVWWALMTSGEFGVEREVVEKAALERMPIPDFDQFDEERVQSIELLFDDLVFERRSWTDVDLWVTDLYGLPKRDFQTIEDTLAYNLPYATHRARAEAPPSSNTLLAFCDTLTSELRPWTERYGTRLDTRPIPTAPLSPWACIELRRVDTFGGDAPLTEDEFAALLRAADVLAASETELRLGPNRLLHARLAQARYWTRTRARLLAQRIVWTHLDLLKTRQSA